VRVDRAQAPHAAWLIALPTREQGGVSTQVRVEVRASALG
jgi:hypothetical protein